MKGNTISLGLLLFSSSLIFSICASENDASTKEGICQDPDDFIPLAQTSSWLWGGDDDDDYWLVTCGSIADEKYNGGVDCDSISSHDWLFEIEPHGSDCCKPDGGHGACWKDVSDVCKNSDEYMGDFKPPNDFLVFDGEETCDAVIINYMFYNNYASVGYADYAFMQEDEGFGKGIEGCPFKDNTDASRGAIVESDKYFSVCCADGVSACKKKAEDIQNEGTHWIWWAFVIVPIIFACCCFTIGCAVVYHVCKKSPQTIYVHGGGPGDQAFYPSHGPVQPMVALQGPQAAQPIQDRQEVQMSPSGKMLV
jgi:hypothetical protein